jgi:hypothetical protein
VIRRSIRCCSVQDNLDEVTALIWLRLGCRYPDDTESAHEVQFSSPPDNMEIVPSNVVLIVENFPGNQMDLSESCTKTTPADRSSFEIQHFDL